MDKQGKRLIDRQIRERVQTYQTSVCETRVSSEYDEDYFQLQSNTHYSIWGSRMCMWD